MSAIIHEIGLKSLVKSGSGPEKIPPEENIFCVNDQIGESFADLMGFDVLSEYIADKWG